MRKLLPFVAAVVLTAGAVRADTLGDCTQRADLPKAATACSALIKEAKQDRPKLAVAYSNLAAVQRSQGDLKKALSSYGWALVYDSKNANVWHERALVRAALGQTLRSAADETVAIRYDPRKIEAWIVRSDLFRQMGALTKAVSDADEALKLDPKSAPALANRAYAQLRLGQIDKAKAVADEAIKSDAKSARGYLARGLALEKTDKAKAVADLKKAAELDPKDKVAAEALKRLGA